MVLATVYLFNRVNITRDYSVVHDMTPAAWLAYLTDETRQSNCIQRNSVNYNRVQNTLRLEMPYDTARMISYGCLELPGAGARPIFFWVDRVTLLKKQIREPENVTDTVQDSVEFTVSEDIWSNNQGEFMLHDSYVERRHMKRWDEDGKPIYYPDAAQGVDGAYTDYDTKQLINTGYPAYFFAVSAIDKNGVYKIFLGCNQALGGDIYTSDGNRILGLDDLMDGTLFTAAGITADNVQSVTILPDIANQLTKLTPDEAGTHLIFSSLDGDLKYITNTGAHTALITVKNTHMLNIERVMKSWSVNVTPQAPSLKKTELYREQNEPMLYHAPARIRKIVSAVGGTLLDIPDALAFTDHVGAQLMMDFGGSFIYYTVGGSPMQANLKGGLAVLECGTLPIFNSAWQTYSAIAKTGDSMVHNAEQTSALVSMLAGVGMGAASIATGGATAGVGGIMGGSSAVSGITSMYVNEESWKAKKTTIRNSPATVKSLGSGFAAYVKNYVSARYAVLKIDDVSYKKLEDQYYFYGYFLNKTERGPVALRTRTTFDFIKTAGARVSGNCAADALSGIQGIFDRGVTIYHGADGYERIGTGMAYSNDEYEEESE